jgi:hypothetical protein
MQGFFYFYWPLFWLLFFCLLLLYLLFECCNNYFFQAAAFQVIPESIRDCVTSRSRTCFGTLVLSEICRAFIDEKQTPIKQKKLFCPISHAQFSVSGMHSKFSQILCESLCLLLCLCGKKILNHVLVHS